MSSSAGGFGSRAPQNSENLGDYPERIIALLVDATMLPFRQLYFFARRLLVGDFAQNMSERIQPRPPLIVGMHDIPRRPRGVGREEHLVACPRVVEPAGIRFEIHVGQLPDLAPVVDAPLQAPRLLFGADLQPILQQNDPGIDDDLLEYGHHFQEAFGLLLGAEPHHTLDPGSVVPAAVEDHDLPCRRQMWNVSLGVHLRLFALGRRGKRDHPENAWANPLGHGFDRAALAGAVAPSKRMQTLRPSCTTHCWSLTNSTCNRASSRSYSFRFSLPLASESSFLVSVIGSSLQIRLHIQPFLKNRPKSELLPAENEADITGHAAGILEHFSLEVVAERPELTSHNS